MTSVNWNLIFIDMSKDNLNWRTLMQKCHDHVRNYDVILHLRAFTSRKLIGVKTVTKKKCNPMNAVQSRKSSVVLLNAQFSTIVLPVICPIK